MNRLTAMIILLCISSNLNAQAPQKMNYQAVIRNSSNTLVSSAPVGMKISVLQSSISGLPVYVETHTAVTNINALVSVEIGAGTVLSGSFASINWAAVPYFLKTEIDPAGGTNYTITNTSQFLSVPYALFASNGNKRGTAVGEMQYWNGTEWVSIAPGTDGQTLNFCNGIPTWQPCPPLVEAPVANSLWITGTAVASGYINPLPTPYDITQKFAKITGSVYELTVNMPGGGKYKLIQTQGDWLTQYHKVSGTWDAGVFEKKNADPEFDGPPSAGTYKITVDFMTGKYTAVKL
jgi:hypothetical protein